MSQTSQISKDSQKPGLREKLLGREGLIALFGITLSLFHIYTTAFGLLDFITQRGIHLSLGLAVLILMKPTEEALTHRFPSLSKSIRIAANVFDFVLVAVLWWACWVSKAEYSYAIAHAGRVNAASTYAGFILLVVILYLTWRSLGAMLPMLAILFILYALYGRYMPEAFAHRGYSVEKILNYLSSNQNGVFGMCLSVSATTIYMFILFGAFLEISGASEMINDVAIKATGKSRSGPALAAVVSSAFMGTINGSAVANVVATGTFTIPMMKARGYDKNFAGAVESVASTGGQILPPVMGAGAFLMVGLTGISYNTIALAAVIPAVLYFFAAAVTVILHGRKANLQAESKGKIRFNRDTIKLMIACLASIIALIYTLLVINLTSTVAAGIGIIVLVVLMFALFPKKYGLRHLVDSLIAGAKGAGSIIIGCACSGIVVAMVSLTGIGVVFGDLTISLAGTSMFLGLILAALACIVLGMGLPTSAAYVIAASILATPLKRLGVDTLPGHLYLLYYACLSCITPPVALASYAAAGIARADPFKTAVESCKLGFVGFVIPFMFIYNQELLGIGSTAGIITCVVTGVLGVIALSAGFTGYLLSKTNAAERILLFAGGALMFFPETITDIIGLAIFGTAVLMQWRKSEKRKAAPVA